MTVGPAICRQCGQPIDRPGKRGGDGRYYVMTRALPRSLVAVHTRCRLESFQTWALPLSLDPEAYGMQTMEEMVAAIEENRKPLLWQSKGKVMCPFCKRTSESVTSALFIGVGVNSPSCRRCNAALSFPEGSIPPFDR